MPYRLSNSWFLTAVNRHPARANGRAQYSHLTFCLRSMSGLYTSVYYFLSTPRQKKRANRTFSKVGRSLSKRSFLRSRLLRLASWLALIGPLLLAETRRADGTTNRCHRRHTWLYGATLTESWSKRLSEVAAGCSIFDVRALCPPDCGFRPCRRWKCSTNRSCSWSLWALVGCPSSALCVLLLE